MIVASCPHRAKSLTINIQQSGINPKHNPKLYEEYERVNVTQTLELAKKAKASGVGHFIFMSTVKVYGEETGKSRLPRFARNDAYNENNECLSNGISKFRNS